MNTEIMVKRVQDELKLMFKENAREFKALLESSPKRSGFFKFLKPRTLAELLTDPDHKWSNSEEKRLAVFLNVELEEPDGLFFSMSNIRNIAKLVTVVTLIREGYRKLKPDEIEQIRNNSV